MLAADDLVDHAQRLGLFDVQRLLGKNEIATADRADHVRPKRMDAIAGHDPEPETRLVLEYRIWRSDHDVAQQNIFGMHGCWTVHRRDHRHRDIEQVCKNFLTLAVDLVIPTRGEEVEACGLDAVHEGVARTR